MGTLKIKLKNAVLSDDIEMSKIEGQIEAHRGQNQCVRLRRNN